VLKYGWFFIGILMVPCIAAKTAAEEDTTDIPVNMTTPRKTLESFCFAAEAIKRNVKGSMFAALTMIDIPETVQPDEQRKLVGMLVEILDILSPPFVSADATNNGKVSHLWAQGQHRLSFSKGDDGI
jgi:hypothetical protein